MLEIVNNWDIDLIKLSKPRLRKNAIEHYKDRQFYNLNVDYKTFEISTKNSELKFQDRIMVNYLRHSCTAYDHKLVEIFGKVGKNKAYALLNKIIYQKIADIYPFLKEECFRQLNSKLELHKNYL